MFGNQSCLANLLSIITFEEELKSFCLTSLDSFQVIPKYISIVIVNLWSISSTFYEQLLYQYSFEEKITKSNNNKKKAALNTFKRNGALKMLVKLTPVVINLRDL